MSSQEESPNTKTETRGRKTINTDGTKRSGRYVRCTECCKSFYYDHRNPKCKPSPHRKPPVPKKKKESEQDVIDKLISLEI